MSLPETTIYVNITRQSWQLGIIEGEVLGGSYQWQFQWLFSQGKLSLKPSLGKSLIQESLARFLEKYDYQLEVGSNYEYMIKTRL